MGVANHPESGDRVSELEAICRDLIDRVEALEELVDLQASALRAAAGAVLGASGLAALARTAASPAPRLSCTREGTTHGAEDDVAQFVGDRRVPVDR